MGSQLDVVYTDFSKAFDRVCHSILINKLNKIGVISSLLKWVESYLFGRYQSVKVSGWKSRLFLITSGVPQGPFLFNMFINDVVNVFKYSQCFMYADDLKIYYRVNNVDDALRLQNDLNALCLWCHDNLLNLNVKKCKTMTFYRKR